MNYEDLIKNAISKNEVVQLLCGSGRYEIQNSEFVQDVFPTNIMSVLVNCFYFKKITYLIYVRYFLMHLSV